jgi:hypothetical protein
LVNEIKVLEIRILSTHRNFFSDLLLEVIGCMGFLKFLDEDYICKKWKHYF